MKKIILFIWVFSITIAGCKKNSSTPPDSSDSIISSNTIIVSNDVINSSLVGVDSASLTFTASGSGVDKIKVGSILVSDISTIAPIGFLRKVTAITTSGVNKIYTTEQAALADAIIKGNTKYSRFFSDTDIIGEDSSGVDISSQQRMEALSFTFIYSKILFDADGNNSTAYDQIKINGEMKIEPTFDFELDIDGSRVRKLVTKITLKNTNKISAESKIALLNFRKEIVLKTFQLRPFTILIAGVPVPIAKQWIAIVLGIDGNLTARVTAGAQNINTATAGIIYENSTWGTINNQENSFTIQPFTFEGAAKIEPWLQVRYEVRPYGVRESRIYVGIRGSVIGEATTIPTGLSTSLKWGIKFSAKVQMQIWERSVLNYEQVFFEREFLISQSNTAAFPTLTTTSISNITQATAQSGGVINSDGGAIVTVRGVCWSPIPNPTTINSITTNGSGTGSFSGSLTGLLPNTTYYVRAYATNSAGTGYGNEVFFTSPNPTLPSLEALWSFDNCTANDFSGNNHHGIYPGGSPKCQSGINSNSSCFSNDSSDYFDTPGNLTINSSAFSVSYWVKFLPGGIVNNQPGSSAFFQIIDNITGVNNAIRFYNYTYLTNPNQSYWTVTYLQNGVDTHVYTNPNGSNLTNGNWHHFALTCSNGTVNYYLDGNVFLTLSSPSPIYKRIAGGLDDVKNVCLDQIRYYNVPLTPTQVQYIYNNQL